MVPQDDAYTGHEEVVPGDLAVSKHPRQSCQRIRAEAGTLETGPAYGVGHQNSGETKGQPGPLRSRHRVVWLMRANGGVNGVNKGAHKGCRVVLENNNEHLKQRSAEGLPLFRALLSSRQEVVLVSCLWVGPGAPGSAGVQSVRPSAW